MTIDVRADVLAGLQDVPFRAYQDEVAVAANQLGDELAGTSLPLELEGKNAFPRGLGDIDQPAAPYPLA